MQQIALDTGQAILAGAASSLITAAAATGALDHAPQALRRMTGNERTWSLVGVITLVWLCVALSRPPVPLDYANQDDCYTFSVDTYTFCGW